MKADYYETLGVAKSADEKELKSAFRKLAMQFHPDKNPGDADAEHRFKEIGEAYETLKDPQKRAAYDRFGHAAFENGGMNGGGGFGGAGGFADIFEDIFGEMMGGGRQRRSGGRERGADLRYNMEITLEEAYAGKTAQIRVPTSITCDECSGSGAKIRYAARYLQHLQRLRACPCGAGFLLDRTHLPDLPWPRPDHQGSLPEMQWPGAYHRGARSFGQYSSRH